jgi:tol-pal system protein YbgF
VGQAGLFDDKEARQAILDLRKQLDEANEEHRLKQAELNTKMQDELLQLRKILLDLNNQLDLIRSELARQQGTQEQLVRDVVDIQRRQKDVSQSVDDRLRRFEPQRVVIEGKEALVDPEEKRSYELALAQLRTADFDGAVLALSAFQRRYPSSAYSDIAKFWLGNALYGKREYKDAITVFRSLVAAAPTHSRAPESLLAIANCQAEMKDLKASKRTLEDLIKAYPNSEAAQAGKERLAILK